MALIKNHRPIETAFDAWIHGHPESAHPLDEERFYILVKTVIAHSRSEFSRSADWLRERIESVPNALSEDDITNYCDKFVTLQKFHRTPKVPLIRSARAGLSSNGPR